MAPHSFNLEHPAWDKETRTIGIRVRRTMLKWTVCQQRQGHMGSARTPGPGPGAASTSPMTTSKMSSLARRSCGAAIGLLLEQDADTQAVARAARRAARRSARRCKEADGGADGDKENADEQPFSPRAREAYGALRDVSNTPTAEGRLSLKTPDSGKKRSRSQCRDITNIPASVDQPRSRSSGSGRPSLSATPESKRSKPRIQPYEDCEDDVVEAAWPAQVEAQVATLKFLPRQRTTSSGVARIRQSRDLARGVASKAPRISSAPKRHRRKKSASHSATPRFVRPAVETAGDAARCAVVVPLKDAQSAHVTPSSSPKTGRSARTSPEHPESTASVISPGETLLRMLERVAAEEAGDDAPASRTASPMAIDYSPCPLRTTQSLLALRRRLFDNSVLEPNVRTGRLQHTDHPEQPSPEPSSTPLPLTTPLIAAFDRWHRLRDTADQDNESTPVAAGVARTRRSSATSGVSPLACRLAWLRLQAQRDAADPTQCPFPPFGHDGRYLSVDAPEPPVHHASSPQLNSSLLCSRRRRLSGSMPSVSSSSFRVPSTPKREAKRSRCSPASILASDTLSLLNHGPASSASLSSLCSLFPGYRPPSIASASSLSDIPAMSSSPLADACDASLLRRQRCVRRRRRTSLTDIDAVLSSTLSTAASCPNIPRDVDEACPSPPGLSSSGYSSSTTDPLGRPPTSCSASTASSNNLDAPSTASSIRSRRYGLTLPTGIPSPESPLDAVSCRAEVSTLLDPNFMCSTPLLPRAATTTKTTLADKLTQSQTSHAPDRPNVAEVDFDSASLLVNRGSPATDDTWDSHRVQKVVQTPAVKDNSCSSSDPLTEAELNDYVPPSPFALVERRCRSRKGLLFASPGANSALPLDLDLGLDAGYPGGVCSSLLTPSSRCSTSSTSSSYASSSSSCRSRRKSTPWRRSCKDVALPGELELNINATGDQLTVHVVRGSGLRRPGGDSCNAYVKVSLVAGATEEKTFRRTCVHRDSSQPVFDHKFSFEVQEADLEKRVLVSVWHRDRPKR
ncbi:uncharacterized protein LOC127748995 [Frankliniella occidentalis]|uniref:Uncharacterized protein LOC127748995 n=1 Tax=Frankliniella occidentalis TaxID=133901 RepID=A0A9C6TVU5_FRAOC|nr:uncharacterized protein LOC127748995 [Frankliniella occidentalis]